MYAKEHLPVWVYLVIAAYVAGTLAMLGISFLYFIVC